MKILVELAEEKGYNRFHPDWFINNKLEPKTWYLELCLLQHWLREIHKIIVIVRITGDNKYFYEIVYFRENINEYLKHLINDNTTFDTFEQALESGLIRSLKLIK